MLASSSERPYRSHLRPACTACRRRKSRCKVPAGTTACLMCGLHGTECKVPDVTDVQSSAGSTRKARRLLNRALETPTRGAAAFELPTPVLLAPVYSSSLSSSVYREIDAVAEEHQAQPTPISLHNSDDNPRIIGPVVSNDSHVLADYLSSIHAEASGMRLTRPVLSRGANTGTVIFTHVQKRPLGMTTSSSDVASQKLQIVTKLLEPWADHLVDIFLDKVNRCFPLIDEPSFRTQYQHARDRVSPAPLACLYAHALTFWRYDAGLSHQRCPDARFIWNLANEALYSELFMAPGIATITAILLNSGGRPTTSMVANGLQFGAAVSLSHSLGLNRNPLAWEIPRAEKYLRMKIWWCMLVQDRWSSLAYGTPPHIQNSQCDVPQPTALYLCPSPTPSQEIRQAALVFVALVGLTEVLSLCLDYIYNAKRDILSANVTDHPPTDIDGFEVSLNAWVDALPSDIRKIAIRGTQLDIPGSCNLRLSYLAVRLLLHRIRLNEDKKAGFMNAHGESRLCNRFMESRRSAEEIVMLVQELREEQLGDFWMPMAAFTFSQTAAFLTRCALEENNGRDDLCQSPSLRMADELLTSLQHHQQHSGWDLSDICLAQHAEIVKRLLTPGGQIIDASITQADLHGPQDEIHFGAFIDDPFPSIWDSVQNI